MSDDNEEYVRPQMEYAFQIWKYAYSKQNIQLLQTANYTWHYAHFTYIARKWVNMSTDIDITLRVYQ